jgi:tRNA threonylcarbamoyladenosine biosynthesis protein TsaE
LNRKASAISDMQIVSRSADATARAGKSLAGSLKAGDIVCLYGDLGTGKTVLAAGIGAGLGVKECVISPTFVFMRCHRGRLPLYHYDLYRVGAPGEIAALGYEEFLFSDGVCVIEWAERLGYLAPAERLEVRLEHAGGDRRRLRLIARGKRYRELLGDLSRRNKRPAKKKRTR